MLKVGILIATQAILNLGVAYADFISSGSFDGAIFGGICFICFTGIILYATHRIRKFNQEVL